MSQYQDGIDISLKAAGDLSTYQFHCVLMSAARTANICSAITDKIIGILQNKPAAADRAAKIRINGTTKAIAGGVVTAGDLVSTKTDGHLVTVTAGTSTTQYVIGIALETSTADGQIIEILIQPQGRAA